MTDENDNGRSSSAPGGRAPLTLKPRTGGAVSAGVVKESFSHGRSKTVVVETKRRRVDGPNLAAPAASEKRPVFDVRGPAPARPAPPPADAHRLPEDERQRRQKVAAEFARQQQERAAADDRTRPEQAARQREAVDAAEPAPPAAAPRAPRDGAPGPGGPRPPGGVGRGAAPAPAGPEIQRATRQAPRPGSLNLDRRPDFDEEADSRRGAGGKAAAGKAVSRTKGEPKRREERLTIQVVAGDDEGAVERMRSLASVRRARERAREKRTGGGV